MYVCLYICMCDEYILNLASGATYECAGTLESHISSNASSRKSAGSYVCVCVYTLWVYYIHKQAHTHTQIHAAIYMYVCIYVCIYVYMHVCTFVCMYICVCVCVCVYVCLHACMYVCMYV